MTLDQAFRAETCARRACHRAATYPVSLTPNGGETVTVGWCSRDHARLDLPGFSWTDDEENGDDE
jgi:hypothetical protein